MDDGCIQIDNFEYESWFIGNKEYVFFYAARQETIKLAIKHSKG